MKPAMLALATGMALSGCDAARNAGFPVSEALDRSNVVRGVDAVADAVAVQCATLDDIIVRLAVDSLARVSGTTREIVRLRNERRRVCAEAEATRQQVRDAVVTADGTTPAP